MRSKAKSMATNHITGLNTLTRALLARPPEVLCTWLGELLDKNRKFAMFRGTCLGSSGFVVKKALRLRGAVQPGKNHCI